MSSKAFVPQGTNKTPFNPQLQHFDYICGQVMKENRHVHLSIIRLAHYENNKAILNKDWKEILMATARYNTLFKNKIIIF